MRKRGGADVAFTGPSRGTHEVGRLRVTLASVKSVLKHPGSVENPECGFHDSCSVRRTVLVLRSSELKRVAHDNRVKLADKSPAGSRLRYERLEFRVQRLGKKADIDTRDATRNPLLGHNTMHKFGVGVIGATGYIGTPYRAEIRQSPDDARIVALCARRRDRLEAAAKEDSAELITDDWREVVEHPDVDVVMVLTPDALHIEPALAAAELGKHLVCEKPLGMDVGEADRIWGAYREKKLGHFVPLWTRYIPAFQRARQIVTEGKLGEVRAIVYRWHNPRPLATPFTWRDDASLSSAGSIADVGSHAYDALRWTLGEQAQRVLAHARPITPEKPDVGAIDLEEALTWGGEHQLADSPQLRQGATPDYANVAIEFESGAVGTMVLSHAPVLSMQLAPELELHGTEASLSVSRVTGELKLDGRGGDRPELVDTLPFPGFGNRFSQYVFPALRERMESGSSDHPGLDDGWFAQRFTNAASRSALEGGWVNLRTHQI